MPIDVAVQEPRSSIVSEESDGHIIPRISHAHDIADHRVVIVVSRISSAANHVEVVPVQVDRVLAYVIQSGSHDKSANSSTAYRSTKSKRACRKTNLDALLALERVDGPFREKVRRRYTVQDLEKYRNAR